MHLFIGVFGLYCDRTAVRQEVKLDREWGAYRKGPIQWDASCWCTAQETFGTDHYHRLNYWCVNGLCAKKEMWKELCIILCNCKMWIFFNILQCDLNFLYPVPFKSVVLPWETDRHFFDFWVDFTICIYELYIYKIFLLLQIHFWGIVPVWTMRPLLWWRPSSWVCGMDLTRVKTTR